MAARDANPDPDVSPYMSLIPFRDWCQDQLARMTMRTVDYDVYAEITRNFRAQDMPYENFRFQMGELLQWNPDYAHLQVYWEVFHRDFIGERRMVDNPLFLVPVTYFYLSNVILTLILDFARSVISLANQDFSRSQAGRQLLDAARSARSHARRIQREIQQAHREARIRADLLKIMAIQERHYHDQDPNEKPGE